MSSYYDSDDDVAWGPLTLREIKRTLKNPVSRKVNRRHTMQAPTGTADHSKGKRKPMEMENQITNDKTLSLTKDVISKCNITSSSSEYYTPNVTAIEKNTAAMVNSPKVESFSKVSPNVDFEETQIKFLNLANNRNTDFDLKNVQQTLVECTILNESSEYENRESSDEMHDSCIVKSVDSSKHSQNFEDDIIVVSSDEDNDSFLTAKTRSYQNVTGKYSPVKKEIVDLEESLHTDYGYLIPEEFLVKNKPKHIVEISDDDIQSDLSEENISSDNIFENHFETDENITVGEEQPRLQEFSPVQVPNIDLAAFDESDDCLKLNNTLEEIERMLNAESDNSQESQDTHNLSSEACSSVNLNSSCLSSELDVIPNQMHIISGSFSQSPLRTNLDNEKTVFSGRKPTPRKLKSPSKICYNFKTEKTTLSRKEEIGVKRTTPVGHFRIPKTPVNPKPTVLNNKNIVSPVGIYIKYSPKTPLTKYIKPTECKKGVAISHIPQSQKVIKTNKENRDVLPPVVYQPAKNKLFTMQEQLILPASIDKMVKKSNVIKHEKRVNLGAHDEDSLQRKLNMETELTKNSISDSLLDENNQDVSVLTSKQAFKK